VELRRELPHRKVELRCEHEHREAGLQAQAAVDEPHADRDRDERDAERCRQLEHGAREEADSERRHRRPAVALADLREDGRLGPRAVERPQRRQASDHVQEMRRQEPECKPALARPLLRVPPDQPHEERHERQRQ
jgi:hypothetical protein